MIVSTTVRKTSILVWSSNFVDYSIESVVFVSFVFYYTSGAIGLFEGVRSFNLVSIALFNMLFFVTGVRIVDGVVEVVFGMSL